MTKRYVKNNVKSGANPTMVRFNACDVKIYTP
jgi:hypothetical protein